MKIAVADIARAKWTQWGGLARGLTPCMHAWGQRLLATMRWRVSVRRHVGVRDIIWFRSFVLENDGEYVGALLLYFFVGMFASALRVWHRGGSAAASRWECRCRPGTIFRGSASPQPSAGAAAAEKNISASSDMITHDHTRRSQWVLCPESHPCSVVQTAAAAEGHVF